MTGRSRAGCRFFERQPHRLGTDRIDQTQDNHLIGEQPQGPVAPSARWVGAGQFDQFLLNIPFNLDLVRPRRSRSGVEGRFDPLGDEPLPDPSDRPRACAQGCDDVLIAVPLAMNGIRQEQDPGMSQLAACGLPSGDQAFQRRLFFRGQSNPELFHRGAPSLEGHPLIDTPKRQESTLPVNLRLSAH